MTNQDHIDILAQGISIWNQWRIDHTHITPNLRNANLGSANLRNANLSGADLSYAVLSGADLSEANLRNADLTGAKLSFTKIKYAELTGANFTDADLSFTDFTGAKLLFAKLKYAKLSSVNFSRCLLPDVDLSKAKLRDADLSGADLSGADLSGADLTNANLRGSFLVGAKLHGANLHWAHLEKAYLCEAILVKANLSSAHMKEAFIGSTHFEGGHIGSIGMDECDFGEAHLEQASLCDAHLEEANLINAHLEQANLRSSHLEGADLSSARLDGAILCNAFFDDTTKLDNITLADGIHQFASLADIKWRGVNLTVINWAFVKVLGDEYLAHKAKISSSKMQDRPKRLDEYRVAVRANRQLAVVLRNQGMNEEADHFAYRAQVLQRIVLYLQALLPHIKLIQRLKKLIAYIFLLFLDLLAGYGYRPGRSVIAYLLIILGFAVTFYTFGHLQWYEALVVSLTAFHGRGFFSQQYQPGDPQSIIAAIEAVIGLIIEISFIATFTQRFFGR